MREADGRFKTLRASDRGHRENLLREIWRDGRLLVDEDLGAIRARADAAMEPGTSHVG